MNYVIDHIPLSTPCRRRQGVRIQPSTLTIHGTANETSTAQNERNWLCNTLNEREASFHIVVDERTAIECIPLNEKALHAGDQEGNVSSIGIEICESGDYAKTLTNAVELVAKLLKERGWDVGRLRRHQEWSGKICPRKMYDGGKWTGWAEFKARVSDKLTEANKPVEIVKPADPNHVTVCLNGKRVADGRLENGKTWVELRAVAEALGTNVEWIEKTKTVNLT